MDDLYDDLDNYNEGSTIALLQSENKELKVKLEEYASTLDKLQKDFDKLSSEYKKLEFNYSSLLKTARAEIERKTQLITNLNIEKDKMVLMVYQNKNSPGAKRFHFNNKPNVKQNCNEDRDIKPGQSKISKETEGCRKSLQSGEKERKDDNYSSSRDTTPSSNPDNTYKYANAAVEHIDPRGAKNRDVKENMLPTSENITSRALIRNRRKSMPAASMDMENVLSDIDTKVRSGNSYALSREIATTNSYNSSDKLTSKMSDTFNLDDRMSDYNELDPRKSRYSKHETDRYRRRDKSSYRYKRYSPDRYATGSRDYYNDPYYSSGYDRRRTLESPSNDRHRSQRRSREPHRNHYERSRVQENERLQHQNHESHSMKHKIHHSYDETDTKRMKTDPYYRHREEERRLQNERDFLEKKYIADQDNIQFSSCESPDYLHPDLLPTHQIREIKLTATSKLDDPRVYSKKYVLLKTNGTTALSTVESRNLDIIPVNKNAWGIEPVSMPDALVKKPSSQNDEGLNQIYMDIDNPLHNLEVDSGEVCNADELDSQIFSHSESTIDNQRQVHSDVLEIPASNADELNDIENSSYKHRSYKIPKLKNTVDHRQSRKKSQELTPLQKLVQESQLEREQSNSENIQNIDGNDEERIQEDFHTHAKNEMPYLGNSELFNKQKYVTAKEVVEGDLELSDDTCDNMEPQTDVPKEVITQIQSEDNKIDASKNILDARKNSKIIKSSVSGEANIKKSSAESCKDRITDDVKKAKNKRKPKHKEVKEISEGKDSMRATEKNIKKKEKGRENKTTEIKTKFSELFGDSSSLITPEDLGLTAVPASTTRLPDQCVPFFEDAQDAVDILAIKLTNAKSLEISQGKENQLSTDIKEKSPINTDSTNSERPDVNCDEMETTTTEEPLEIIYKNIEPAIPVKENDVVIISTGVQPQISVDSEKPEIACNSEPPMMNTNRDVALKALATSTPHKTVHLNAQSESNGKLLDIGCSSNDNEIATADNPQAIDNSDTNTLDGQTNQTDAPDVRIFVRRRRKVLKK